MNLSQQKIIENYTSLKSKVNTKKLGTILAFCIYFQSDNIELYREFEEIYSDMYFGAINIKSLMKLYAKCYHLDPIKDNEQIVQIFINNTINNGFSYHLSSTANYNSIQEYGLGIEAIGLKTEERKDYELLSKYLSFETLKKLQPFYKDNQESKVFYSNLPILNARYGDKPEWLKELKINANIQGNLIPGSKEEELVNQILTKYEKKYENAGKVLFLIPNPSKDVLQAHLDFCKKQQYSPERTMAYFINMILTQKNLNTKNYISPDHIISINLNTQDMYYNYENMTTKTQQSGIYRR